MSKHKVIEVKYIKAYSKPKIKFKSITKDLNTIYEIKRELIFKVEDARIIIQSIN